MNEYKAIKIALIGSAGVGKSSLGNYLTNKDFEREYISTIGVDMMNAYVHNEKIKISFWDLAGMERFQSIVKGFIESSNCLAFCFSVYNPFSVEQMITRYKYCKKEGLLENKDVIVCALKIDLQDNCSQLGKNFADKHGFPFFKASAMKKEGKKEIFDYVKSTFQMNGFELEEKSELRVYVEEPPRCPSCCVM